MSAISGEEDGFVKALWRADGNMSPWLIYADWLEEAGDAVRAEFLRIGVALRDLDRDRESDPDLYMRYHELTGEVEPDWLALLSMVRRFAVIWDGRDAECLRDRVGRRLGVAWAGPDNLMPRAQIGYEIQSTDEVYVIAIDPGTPTPRLVGRISFERWAPTSGQAAWGGSYWDSAWEKPSDLPGDLIVGRHDMGSPIRLDRHLPADWPSWFRARARPQGPWIGPGMAVAWGRITRRRSLVEVKLATARMLDRLTLGWIGGEVSGPDSD